MRNFIIVLKFELENYFKNKVYLLTTFGLGILLSLAMFTPTLINLFNTQESNPTSNSNDEVILLVDQKNIIKDTNLISTAFSNVNIKIINSEDEVKKAVENEEVLCAFVVDDLNHFTYYVKNKGMSDYNVQIFQEMMIQVNIINYANQQNLDIQELASAVYPDIKIDEQILGKDNMSQYWYCYTLVIIVFVLLTMYGQMIATSITVEKSNRSIEMLITSTTPYSLLCGKVVAGAIAGVVQMGVVLLGVLTSYQINKDAWDGALDMLLNIPVNVLSTFAVFGIGGYLFYAFLYGMLGALVSKTEDINKSSAGLQMILMIAYLIALFQLSNPSGMIMKITSYLPFTSFISMFIRVAMGTVSIVEVIISIIILLVSVILAGILGAKIYRQQVLRYGNRIRFLDALKSLKEK